MTTTKKYNINTQVSFDSKEVGLCFNPPKTSFTTEFAKLVSDMENVAGDIQRIIMCPQFHQFIQGLTSDNGGKFQEIVNGSFRCKAAKEAI